VSSQHIGWSSIPIDLLCPHCKNPLPKDQSQCINPQCNTRIYTYFSGGYCIPILVDINEPHIKPHREFSDENAGVLVSGKYFTPPKNAYKYIEEKKVISRLKQLKSEHEEWKEVLDIGCGDGRYLEPLSRLGFRITGIDISQNMIEWSIRTANSLNLGNNFVPLIADGANLPLPDNFYDIILGLFGWPSFTPEYHKAIREMYRVLKPGGHVFVVPYNADSLTNLIAEKFKELKNEKIFLTRFPNDEWILVSESPSGRRIESKIYCHAFTPKELRELFELAGFEIIEQDSIMKIVSLFPSDVFRGVDPNICIQFEELANTIRGLSNAGSYIFLEARKPYKP